MIVNPEQVDRHTAYEPRGAALDLFYCRDEEILMEGPAGCVAGETILDGSDKSIAEQCRAGERPTVQTLYGRRLACVPFLKGRADLYRVTLVCGRAIVATGDHLMLTPQGWCYVSGLLPGMECLSSVARHQSGGFSYSHSKVQWSQVQSIAFERTDDFYDLHVPVENHYFAGGILHHNTGKTRGILEKINLLAMKYRNMRALLVRKTRASMTESVLKIFETAVIPSGSPVLNGADRQSRKRYDYPNGSEVVTAGMDNPDRIMSTDFDVVAVFEATELNVNDFENLTTRLGRVHNSQMAYSQIIADCNPGAPSHWLNRRAAEGRMRRLLSRHEHNPIFFDKAGNITPRGAKYLARLDRLTGPRYQRLRRGIWAAAEGMVYDGWDPAIHLIDRFPIPHHWPRILSIDFGFTNPFVCQWWAMDEDRRMYLYREIYMSRRIVEDHARQIAAAMVEDNGAAIEAIVADHDAEDRATLSKHGITTSPAMKSISVGIEAVKSRMVKQPDGRPRIFIMRDSMMEIDPELKESGQPVSTAEEIESYLWPTATSATVDRRAKSEKPMDKWNHGMDGMRYAVAHVDGITADSSLGLSIITPYDEAPEQQLQQLFDDDDKEW